MTQLSCPLERRTLDAAKTGHWEDDLRNHAESCPVCSGTMRVTIPLNALAAETIEGTRPGNFRLVWLKAQFTKRQERLTNLDRFALIAMSLAGVVASAGTVFWIRPEFLKKFLDIFSSVASQPSALWPVVVLVGCLALVWALTEESFYAKR